MSKWFSGKKYNKKKILYGSVAFILAGGMILSAVLGFGFAGALNGGGAQQIQERPADEVVASVNGEEIKWQQLENQLEYMMQQYMSQGIEPQSEEMQQMLPQIKQQLLQDMISNVIVMKEAEKEGISPEEENIEQRYQQFVDQYGGEEDKILEELETAGFSLDDLKEDIARELTITEYTDYALSEYMSDEEIVISEEEKQELFEQYRAHDEEISYEEIEQELEEMLKQEKEQEMMEEIVQELKEDYEINIYL